MKARNNNLYMQDVIRYMVVADIDINSASFPASVIRFSNEVYCRSSQRSHAQHMVSYCGLSAVFLYCHPIDSSFSPTYVVGKLIAI